MKRIYHTWDKWECYPAGFYSSRPKDTSLSVEQCREAYAAFLKDEQKFGSALDYIINNWPRSCEHYLSNEKMNRIAWLGQASACHALNIPSNFRGGFNLLSQQDRDAADTLALKYLNIWLEKQGEAKLTMSEAQSKSKADLY